jgi:hypothetical protein
VRRIFFFGSFLLAGLAVVEKVFNLLGYTLLREVYAPMRLLEFSAIGLLFVITLQLRDIKISLSSDIKKEMTK